MLQIAAEGKREIAYKKEAQALALWLLRRFKKSGHYLEINIVSTRTLKKNVLAYPPGAFPRPELSEPPLGEIYLNPTIIRSQGYTVTYMLIHGFLHLLGYDHKKKNDTIEMESLETELLEAWQKRQAAK